MKNIENPLVTVVVPFFNELAHIDAIVSSLSEQNYPSDRIEVLFIDGGSNDGSLQYLKKEIKNFGNWSILFNANKTVSYALNMAIDLMKGDYLIRMDMHSDYPENYISSLIHYSLLLQAFNVGAVCRAVAPNDDVIPSVIAKVLSSAIGVGGSTFRISNALSHPLEVDTVPFGCYPKHVFEICGKFDVELIRNQDDEFNARVKLKGGKIFLIPDLTIKYYTRSTLSALGKMGLQYGYFKPLCVKKIGSIYTLRQLAPSAMVLSFTALILSFVFQLHALLFALSAGFCIYLFLILFMSFRYFGLDLLRVASFFVAVIWFHFNYGLGYLWGGLNIIFGGRVGVFEISR